MRGKWIIPACAEFYVNFWLQLNLCSFLNWKTSFIRYTISLYLYNSYVAAVTQSSNHFQSNFHPIISYSFSIEFAPFCISFEDEGLYVAMAWIKNPHACLFICSWVNTELSFIFCVFCLYQTVCVCLSLNIVWYTLEMSVYHTDDCFHGPGLYFPPSKLFCLFFFYLCSL